MPEVFRIPTRMECRGIDLTHPVDRMPPGGFPYLNNARVTNEGRIESRPGYEVAITLSDIPNSIRRLNDPSDVYAPDGYIYVGGAGDNLYAGIETDYTSVDSGYSGNPLSLIPFRPDQSPESWMYVYDQDKLSKVRPDKVVYNIGLAPPPNAPTVEYAPPAYVQIDEGQVDTGWNANSTSSSPTATDRTGGSATISQIFYNNGTIGWAQIIPTDTDTSWQANRMEVILGGTETVVVREVHLPIASTTVAAIQYDIGTTGNASIILTASPQGLSRNSLIEVGGEFTRVREIVPTPDGTGYCVRVTTTGSHSVGDAVNGTLSWFVYTYTHHADGESIAANYVKVTQTTGVGSINKAVTVDASLAAGREIDAANDYLHLSLFITDVSVTNSIQVLLSLDATPNYDFVNPGNSYVWVVTPFDLVPSASAASWFELVVPISNAIRYGSDLTKNLSTITGLAIQMDSSANNDYGFDWWYLFGTYGLVVQPNSPVGVVYATRFRDSSTGAHSVPGVQTRFGLFPLREGIEVTAAISHQVGVDAIDIYREGGAVTSPLYVASIDNDVASPLTYTDSLPDFAVLEADQPPDLTAIQPWPLLQDPWTGVCDVVGTNFTIVSGSLLNPQMLGDTVVLINGNAFLINGSPISLSTAQLTQSAGNLTNATFLIASPTLFGQPLPFAFGALEGPFAPVVFGLGDPLNGGLLYFSNFNDADSASDANTLELAPPTSNLVSGTVWNGMAFAGNRETVFCIRFSYLTTIGASSSTSFQWNKIPTPGGMWSRWTCCAGPDGIYFLGRDGIYHCTDQGCVSITDETLYPLFPHDGQAAVAPFGPTQGMQPVDMSQI